MSTYRKKPAETIFACKLTDADLVRACAPEQPETIEIGQNWMRLETGSELPVKRVREDYIDLGGQSYTVIVSPATLRSEWVCTDLPPLPPVASIQETSGAREGIKP